MSICIATKGIICCKRAGNVYRVVRLEEPLEVEIQTTEALEVEIIEMPTVEVVQESEMVVEVVCVVDEQDVEISTSDEIVVEES
jgi:hypothetical protein